jgi:hypothetical protein
MAESYTHYLESSGIVRNFRERRAGYAFPILYYAEIRFGYVRFYSYLCISGKVYL